MKLFLRPLRRQQDDGNASLPLAAVATITDVAVAGVAGAGASVAPAPLQLAKRRHINTSCLIVLLGVISNAATHTAAKAKRTR